MVAAMGIIAVVIIGRQEMSRHALQRQLAAETRPIAADAKKAAAPAVAAPVPNEELEHARNEIAQLRRQVKDARHAEQEEENQRRFAIGRLMPGAEWKNAGVSTVPAALETVLWCGANGDVETLARTISLVDPQTRAAAEALLQRLRAQIPAEIATPEQLLAFLTIKDMPRVSAEARKYAPLENWSIPAQLVDVFLAGEDGVPRNARLLFT